MHDGNKEPAGAAPADRPALCVRLRSYWWLYPNFRWSRLLLPVVLAGVVTALHPLHDPQRPLLPLIGLSLVVAACAAWALMVAAEYASVSILGDVLVVRRRWLGQSRSIPAAEIVCLYTTRTQWWAPRYQNAWALFHLWALLRDGQRVRLVRGLPEREPFAAIIRKVHDYLGLSARRVMCAKCGHASLEDAPSCMCGTGGNGWLAPNVESRGDTVYISCSMVLPWIGLAAPVPGILGAVYAMMERGSHFEGWWTFISLAVGIVTVYWVVVCCLNRAVVEVSERGVGVSFGPLPSPWRRVWVSGDRIRQHGMAALAKIDLRHAVARQQVELVFGLAEPAGLAQHHPDRARDLSPAEALVGTRMQSPVSAVEQICPGCGYNLRASRERCPECGLLVAPRA